MPQSDETQRIDWKSLWKELDWDDGSRQQEAVRRRLEQRARQYAALTAEADEAADAHTMLVFNLGEEQYAVDVMMVRSVRTIDSVTPVPATPNFYAGVVNIRGQIVTVMDLRLFFDMEVDPHDPPRELIVLQGNGLEIGLLAHHVRDVISIPNTKVEPLEDVRYARGMMKDGVILLDAARMFEDERLIVGGVDE